MSEKKLYEGMYIISSVLTDDLRNKALERIKKGIEDYGGEVVKIHDWGRKRMAYEINGHREGHYYVVYFEVKPAAIAELWADYRLHEDLIRYTTLKADKVLEKIEFKPIVEE